jgi:hypothetical protein
MKGNIEQNKRIGTDAARCYNVGKLTCTYHCP